MKNQRKSLSKKSAAAFTLVEMLVVIAIIALVAGLIAAGGVHAIQQGKIHRVQSELTNIKTAIEAYKGRKGFYPPDNYTNGNNFSTTVNGLYFELAGTILKFRADGTTPDYYVTLDGQNIISNKFATNWFGLAGVPVNAVGPKGLANSTSIANPNDDNFNVETFLKGLSPAQVTTNSIGVRFLMADTGIPWNYVSTNPTNNPGSYDLWADIMIGGKINRICNWSDKPIVK